MDETNIICSLCHQAMPEKYYFCPNCGNSLKEKLVAVSIIIQIGLYALAIFVPPLGLWPGIKYMMKKGQQAKRVGMITIVLTIISTVITIWAIFSVFNNYLGQLDVLYEL